MPTIHPSSIVDADFRPLLTGGTYGSLPASEFHESVAIGRFCVVGQACRIAGGVIIDDFSRIENEVVIEESTLICYRATLCNEARIGARCVIGGFIGERAIVGDDCRVFGSLVHRFSKPAVPWDGESSMEVGPTLESGVVVAFHACVVGAIRIGKNAYIGPGVVIRSDVPAGMMIKGAEK